MNGMVSIDGEEIMVLKILLGILLGGSVGLGLSYLTRTIGSS